MSRTGQNSGQWWTCSPLLESQSSSVDIARLKWFLSQRWKHVLKPAVSSSNMENTGLTNRVRRTEVSELKWLLNQEQYFQVAVGYIALCLKMENTAIHHACFPHSYIIYLFFSYLVESCCFLSQSQCHHLTKLFEKMNNIKNTSSLKRVLWAHSLWAHLNRLTHSLKYIDNLFGIWK